MCSRWLWQWSTLGWEVRLGSTQPNPHWAMTGLRCTVFTLVPFPSAKITKWPPLERARASSPILTWSHLVYNSKSQGYTLGNNLIQHTLKMSIDLYSYQWIWWFARWKTASHHLEKLTIQNSVLWRQQRKGSETKGRICTSMHSFLLEKETQVKQARGFLLPCPSTLHLIWCREPFCPELFLAATSSMFALFLCIMSQWTLHCWSREFHMKIIACL